MSVQWASALIGCLTGIIAAGSAFGVLFYKWLQLWTKDRVEDMILAERQVTKEALADHKRACQEVLILKLCRMKDNPDWNPDDSGYTHPSDFHRLISRTGEYNPPET